MSEKKEEMTPERIKYIEDTIMSVLFELYEDQTGLRYTIDPDDKKQTEEAAG